MQKQKPYLVKVLSTKSEYIVNISFIYLPLFYVRQTVHNKRASFNVRKYES